MIPKSSADGNLFIPTLDSEDRYRFERLYNGHAAAIYKLVSKCVESQAGADELFKKIICEIWSKANEFLKHNDQSFNQVTAIAAQVLYDYCQCQKTAVTELKHRAETPDNDLTAHMRPDFTRADFLQTPVEPADPFVDSNVPFSASPSSSYPPIKESRAKDQGKMLDRLLWAKALMESMKKTAI